jgi:hypothetical protein
MFGMYAGLQYGGIAKTELRDAVMITEIRCSREMHCAASRRDHLRTLQHFVQKK